MKRPLATVFILVTLLASAGGHAAGKTPPTPAAPAKPSPEFTATYIISKAGVEIGEVTRKVYRGKGSYVYYSKSTPIGMATMVTNTVVTEFSEWRYEKGRPKPLNYTYDRRGDNKLRQVKLTFDWKKKSVKNGVKNENWQAAVPADSLDKLLYQLAISHDLQRGNRKLSYQVPDSGTVKLYQFRVGQEESIDTDMGTYRALKVERSNGKETTIWCAAKVGFLPVKLEQEGLTMTLKSLSRTPKI